MDKVYDLVPTDMLRAMCSMHLRDHLLVGQVQFIRAVPEIILGGALFFFQTPPPPGHTWSQSPPTPRTRKYFN